MEGLIAWTSCYHGRSNGKHFFSSSPSRRLTARVIGSWTGRRWLAVSVEREEEQAEAGKVHL